MRLLLDQNLAETIIDYLDAVAFDAVHTRQIGMSRAADEEVMAYARREDRIVVSQDTDSARYSR